MNNGDDCFSPKANTSNIYVNEMYCNGESPKVWYIETCDSFRQATDGSHCAGSHGESMGSIGQYSGEMDYIENVLIENVWIINSQFGGRLKTWAGPDVGYGYINNVTFRNFYNADNQYAAYLDSCYFNVSPRMARVLRFLLCSVRQLTFFFFTDQFDRVRPIPFSGEYHQHYLRELFGLHVGHVRPCGRSAHL